MKAKRTSSCEEFFYRKAYGYQSENEYENMIGMLKKHWTALDILTFSGFSAIDKLEIVLREKLIDEPTLHEFACRCAEQALNLVKHPDRRSVEAVNAKRLWMQGKCSSEHLKKARARARAVDQQIKQILGFQQILKWKDNEYGPGTVGLWAAISARSVAIENATSSARQTAIASWRAIALDNCRVNVDVAISDAMLNGYLVQDAEKSWGYFKDTCILEGWRDARENQIQLLISMLSQYN